MAGEGTRPDPALGEFVVDRGRVAGLGQDEQARAANQPQTVACKQPAQARCHFAEPAPGRRLPSSIAESRCPDDQRRIRHRPVAEQAGKASKERLRTGDETEPQAGQPEEFSEGTQDDGRQIAEMREQAQLRHEVGERLVDHDKTASRGEALRELRQRLGISRAAVGIVGVGEHHNRGVGGQLVQRRNFLHRAARRQPGVGVALIGRRENRDPTRRRDEGEQPERDFAARAWR